MKHISKKELSGALLKWLHTPDMRSFSPPPSHELHKFLLAEQNFLCAYCNQKIDLGTMSIEHFISQKIIDEVAGENVDKYPHNIVQFVSSIKFSKNDPKNLLAVCKGAELDIDHKKHHCDKTKNGKQDGLVFLKKLNPMDVRCETQLQFTKDGKVYARNEKDEDIGYDIQVLNLNSPILVSLRKERMFKLLKDIKERAGDKSVTKSFAEKLMEKQNLEFPVLIKQYLEKKIK